MYLQICKKLGSANRKSAKCHICGRFANLTKLFKSTNLRFAIRTTFLRTAHLCFSYRTPIAIPTDNPILLFSAVGFVKYCFFLWILFNSQSAKSSLFYVLQSKYPTYKKFCSLFRHQIHMTVLQRSILLIAVPLERSFRCSLSIEIFAVKLHGSIFFSSKTNNQTSALCRLLKISRTKFLS